MYKTLQNYNNNNIENYIEGGKVISISHISQSQSPSSSSSPSPHKKWGTAAQIFKRKCDMTLDKFTNHIWNKCMTTNYSCIDKPCNPLIKNSVRKKKFEKSKWKCRERNIPSWALPLHNPFKEAFENYNIPQTKCFTKYYLEVLSPSCLNEDFSIISHNKNKKLLNNLFGDTWPQSTIYEEDWNDLCWHYNSFFEKRSFSWVIRKNSNDEYVGCCYYFPIMNVMAPNITNAEVYMWFSALYPIDQLEMTEFYREFIDWLHTKDWPQLTLSIFTPQDRNSGVGII